MKSTTAKFFALTIVSIFMAAFMARSPALAAGEDKGKNQSTPSGWEQGNKTGWEGDTPPGLTEEKLEKKKKAGKKSGKHKAKAKKGDLRLVVIVLGSPTAGTRDAFVKEKINQYFRK